jgi:hypothetical protein
MEDFQVTHTFTTPNWNDPANLALLNMNTGKLPTGTADEAARAAME